MSAGKNAVPLPVWAQMAEVKRLTGLPDGVVRQLANEGKVGARKACAAANAACLFCVADVLEWIEREAPKPGRFRLVSDVVNERKAVGE